MKRLQTILLTLVLSVAMLAPEFSMLPAAYAQDQTPALEQTAGEAEAFLENGTADLIGLGRCILNGTWKES